jgi:hypothetical protein
MAVSQWVSTECWLLSAVELLNCPWRCRGWVAQKQHSESKMACVRAPPRGIMQRVQPIRILPWSAGALRCQGRTGRLALAEWAHIRCVACVAPLGTNQGTCGVEVWVGAAVDDSYCQRH